MSDIILINKSDGDFEPIAKRTAAQYRSALNLFRHRKYDPPNFPQVIPISSLSSSDLANVWSKIEELILWRKQKGYFDDIRKNQKIDSFNRELNNVFHEKVIRSKKIKDEIEIIKDQINLGILTPEIAAEELIKKILA